VTLHSPDPIEIDPRSCGNCGLKIDRHEMVDDGEGPEFFCLSPDEMTLPELVRRAELIRQIEVAAIVARMEADGGTIGEPPSTPAEPRPYRTPQATIDAFWYVVRLDDVGRFALLESSLSC
jgi:hypothetical protein